MKIRTQELLFQTTSTSGMGMANAYSKIYWRLGGKHLTRFVLHIIACMLLGWQWRAFRQFFFPYAEFLGHNNKSLHFLHYPYIIYYRMLRYKEWDSLHSLTPLSLFQWPLPCKVACPSSYPNIWPIDQLAKELISFFANTRTGHLDSRSWLQILLLPQSYHFQSIHLNLSG